MGFRFSGPTGTQSRPPDVVDAGTTQTVEHHAPGITDVLQAAARSSPLMLLGPGGVVAAGAATVGQLYYAENLAALNAARSRAAELAPAAIAEATGFDDLAKLFDSLLHGLFAIMIALAASTALGGAIGGVVGFFFGGAGAAPGAVVGAKAGFEIGMAVLTWLGLGFLVASIIGGLGELINLQLSAVRRGWAAGDLSGPSRDAEVEAAAKDLAKAAGVLVRLILEGILAYLMRGAPMATTRAASTTLSQVGTAGSEAVAAEAVAGVVAQLRTKQLGNGLADWVQLNWRKLLDNPKLRRYGPDGAPPKPPVPTQTPSQLRQQAGNKTPDGAQPSSASPSSSGPSKRPSWRDSEKDVGAKLGPDYKEQVSFKNGQEVPYGTKGSTRPDFYKPGQSVEVKNYDVSTQAARDRLVDNVSNQAIQRAKELPKGTLQTLQVDVRGQSISLGDAAKLTKTIETNSGGAIKATDITIIR